MCWTHTHAPATAAMSNNSFTIFAKHREASVEPIVKHGLLPMIKHELIQFVTHGPIPIIKHGPIQTINQELLPIRKPAIILRHT